MARTRQQHRQGDYLHDADDNFLDCRALRHRWEDTGRFFNGKEAAIVMQCKRCDTYSILSWDRVSGERVNRTYVYTSGYLNATGERFTGDELRSEVIRRSDFGTKTAFDALLAKFYD